MYRPTEKWVVAAKKADFVGLGKELCISPYLARLLVNRGISDPEAIRRYLKGSADDLNSPYLLKGIQEGCGIIRDAVLSGVKIMICADYDVDGVFSAYILKRTILALGGYAYVNIPDRVAEGYGMNERMVEEAVTGGYGVILTCDNGIASFDAVKKAKRYGLKVVITDHHETIKDAEGRELLPEADAIIDPKQESCPYPFNGICGAFVAYKFIQVLTAAFSEKGDISLKKAEELIEPLLMYAAFATVTDVMELTDENRLLVKEGLKRLKDTDNTGLSALMDVCGINRERLSAFHIGFILGPCLNAAGRLYNAYHALQLLECGDHGEAVKMAEGLKQMNEQRKALTEDAVKTVFERIDDDPGILSDKILVIILQPGTHESLAGIIAGRIKERYSRPVIAFCEVEKGVLKGSGRSVDGYDMFAGLSLYGDLYIKMGGHAKACGITMKREYVEELSLKLNKDCPLEEEQLVKKVLIDIPMPIQYLSVGLIEEISSMEPFGNGNPRPIFAENHFNIKSAKVMGRNNNVLKLRLKNKDGYETDGIMYGDPKEMDNFLEENFGKEELSKIYEGRENSSDIAIAYFPEINDYKGSASIQIQIRNYCRIS